MDLIVIEFSRARVENRDLSKFLGQFDLDHLPVGIDLKRLCNSMSFHVSGYDHDRRELHCISEVREFYRALRQAWPYFLYFGTFETDSLKSVILCFLEDVVSVQRDGHAKIGSHYDFREFGRLLLELFGPMNLLCERAGMTEREIRARTQAVFKYFELAFEAD